jgi:hypothetical protein
MGNSVRGLEDERGGHTEEGRGGGSKKAMGLLPGHTQEQGPGSGCVHNTGQQHQHYAYKVAKHTMGEERGCGPQGRE